MSYVRCPCKRGHRIASFLLLLLEPRNGGESPRNGGESFMKFTGSLDDIYYILCAQEVSIRKKNLEQMLISKPFTVERLGCTYQELHL